MRPSILFLAVCTSLLMAAPMAAQTAQPISIQGSVLGASLGGNAFQDAANGFTIDPGFGGEIQLRWNPSAFSIGAGFQYTTHVANLADFPDVDVDLDFSGVFIEPRYVIFVGSERAAPYVSGRLMRLVSTLTVSGFGFSESQDIDAWGYNLGGGLLLRVNPRVNLDLGLTAGGITLSFDEPEPVTESGTSVVFRLGLALGV